MLFDTFCLFCVLLCIVIICFVFHIQPFFLFLPSVFLLLALVSSLVLYSAEAVTSVVSVNIAVFLRMHSSVEVKGGGAWLVTQRSRMPFSAVHISCHVAYGPHSQ